jgi:hypothetical protein
MNVVELDGKNILVRSSQAESTKGKEVFIGEERPLRIIKPNTERITNGRKMRGASHKDTQRPPLTSSWPSTKKAGQTLGVVTTGLFDFPKSDQHLCSREFIRQMISDSATSNFRRSGSSSTRLSYDTLLPDRATNAWAVGASIDDVSTLSSLGGVVWAMGATTNAPPPRMVRIY